MTSELYERQSKLPIIVPKEVAIIGCGGSGSWAAQQIIMVGTPVVHLFDPDSFELSNFGRVPLPPGKYTGVNKAEAIKDYFGQLRPDCTIFTYGGANSLTLALINPDIIFDCTDSAEFQEFLESYCQSRGVHYIRSGYNGGDHVTATPKSSTFKTSIKPTSRYEYTPSYVCPAALAGTLAAINATFDRKFNFVGYFSDLATKVK